MGGRTDLVPVGENSEQALDLVLDAFSKSGVSLEECLNGDAGALCAGDMLYFDKEYYGKVPSYGVFMRYLNKLDPEIKDNFMETVAEIEAGRYVHNMDRIATKDKLEGDDRSKFALMDKLNRTYERRMDRIDRRRKDRGVDREKGADLAVRIISALNNADLLKLKDKVEAIDAEFSTKEIADGR